MLYQNYDFEEDSDLCHLNFTGEQISRAPSAPIIYSSWLSFPQNLVLSFKNAVAQRAFNMASPMMLSYSVSMVCTDKNLELKLMTIINSVLSANQEISDDQIRAVIIEIPEQYFANIVRGLVPELSKGLITHSKSMIYSNLWTTFNISNSTQNSIATWAFSKIMSVQLGVIEKIAFATIGSYVSTSFFTDQVVKKLNKEKLTPTLVQMLRYILQATKDSIHKEAVHTTKLKLRDSVLDNVDDFTLHLVENHSSQELKFATEENYIEEYKRALACKYHADQVADEIRKQVASMIKNIDPVSFDSAHKEMFKGLAVDVVLAAIPRLLARVMVEKLLTRNNSEVNALAKIRNAEIIANRDGFILPEPSMQLVAVHIKELQRDTLVTSGLNDLMTIAMHGGFTVIQNMTPKAMQRPLLAAYNSLPKLPIRESCKNQRAEIDISEEENYLDRNQLG